LTFDATEYKISSTSDYISLKLYGDITISKTAALHNFEFQSLNTVALSNISFIKF